MRISTQMALNAFDDGFKAGEASRDAEVAELKAKLSQIEYCAAEYDIKFDKLTEQVTMLRDAILLFRNEPILGRAYGIRRTKGYGAMQAALDATETK